MGSALIAAVVLSCAGGRPSGPAPASSAAPAPSTSPATATATATATSPAAATPAANSPTAERLAFWKDVHARGDAPPAGADVAALTIELLGYLRSPDPDVRDRLAYEVLAAWIGRPGLLPPATAREMTSILLARLRERPAAVGDDTVFGRSFAALVLAEIAARDIEKPTMSEEELTAMVAAARAYAAAETDLRGRVEGRGWAHAAAHTADWLRALSRNPRLGRRRGQLVLDAILDLTIRRHGFVLFDGEDGRLAQPVLDLLRRRHIDTAAFAAWVDKLIAPLRIPFGREFDLGLYAAQRNARNLAFTLFVQLSLEPKPTRAITDALAALSAALRG